MTTQRTGKVIKAYQRMYDDPIKLVSGDKVRITKRDLWNDQHVWIWCIHVGGKEGWVPDSFIDVEGENATALQDYDAIELTVAEGEHVTIVEETHGWYWVKNSQEQCGWVPIENVEVL